jgi:glycosyltransferase involved in cell wall biosynthesis
MDDDSPVNRPPEIDSEQENLPSICVVICTRDRPQKLRRTLQSLQEQTQGPAEILVVDNAPRDEKTKALVTKEFSGARYVRESVQGLDFARNRALAETSKEIVAFIDDDAVAEPSWVENIRKMFFQYPRAGVCTGQITPLALETPGQILFENNGGLMASHRVPLRIPTDASHYGWKWRHMPSIAWAVSLGVGCNLAVRRNMALQLGGFDEALDLGSAMPGGGDHDMVWRMLNAGAEVIYQPLARVLHEHRREMTAVHEQIIGHHVGCIAFLTKAVHHSGGSERIGAVAFLSWRLMKPGVRLFRRAFGRDTLPYPLLLRIWWHCWRSLGVYSTAKKIAYQRASNVRTSICQ